MVFEVSCFVSSLGSAVEGSATPPLHNTTLHCTAPQYIVLHYTTPDYTTLHNTTVHYTALHFERVREVPMSSKQLAAKSACGVVSGSNSWSQIDMAAVGVGKRYSARNGLEPNLTFVRGILSPQPEMCCDFFSHVIQAQLNGPVRLCGSRAGTPLKRLVPWCFAPLRRVAQICERVLG